MLAFALQSVQESALPGSYFPVFFQGRPFGQSRQYDVADTLLGEQLVDEFIHVCQGISSCPKTSGKERTKSNSAYPYFAILAFESP
jgi:hypothetical protein